MDDVLPCIMRHRRRGLVREAILPEILLPAVANEVEQECANSYSQRPSELLAHRAFKPLIEMALLDGQQAEAPLGFTMLKSVKLTPLFSECLSFPDLP